MKIKLKGNKESCIKKGIVYLGEDREGNPILMNVKTRGILNEDKLMAEQEFMNEIKIPPVEKPYVQLNEIEKKIYNIRNIDDAQKQLVLVRDETNPKFLAIKERLSLHLMTVSIVAYFDMGETLYDEDGNEITHWDRWKITSKKLADVVRFVLDEENGLGLGFAEIEAINKEILRLKLGQKTRGEELLEDEYKESEQS